MLRLARRRPPLASCEWKRRNWNGDARGTIERARQVTRRTDRKVKPELLRLGSSQVVATTHDLALLPSERRPALDGPPPRIGLQMDV